MIWNNFVRKFLALIGGISLAIAFTVPVEAGNPAYKFSMSYIYFGSSDGYGSQVDNTKNSLDEISPSYFDLNEDGSLKLTPAADKYFVQEMHKKGIRVVPFLSNHWNRELGRKALANRDALTRQIADSAVKYELDGVNVDIENLTEEDRENYVDFVRLLKERLPQNMTVAVAVAPNPFWAEKGWQGSYDYKALGKYADYIMLMAYDQSYQGGPAGPVAEAAFVEKSVRYALENVPGEKIVLGMPFYGRYWKNDAAYGGYGISLTDVEDLVSKYRGKVYFDTAAQSPKAVFTIKAADPKPYIFGQKLGAGTYTVWYENEASLKHKLKLVQKYGLKGAGSWSLGQETRKTWDYYRLWLNGYYFEDAQGHWAQDSILSMAVRGWMKGASISRFLPENSLTRAETAAILIRAIQPEEKAAQVQDQVQYQIQGQAGESTQSVIQSGNQSGIGFTDISGHWAEEEINIAAQYGIILGRGDGTFAPDRPVTRQEIAVMLDRVLTGLKVSPDMKNPYWDVSRSRNQWSYDSIMKMTHYGIFTGSPDGGFRPGVNTKRAEMAVLMERAAVNFGRK